MEDVSSTRQGHTRRARSGRGDQLVQVKVVTPQKLTAKQKELLRQFAQEGGGDLPEENKGFFERVKDALR